MRGKVRSIKLGIFPAALFLLTASCGCASFNSTKPADPAAGQTVQPVEKKAQAQPAYPPFTLQAPYYPAPTTLDLCGEPAPLHLQEVYERFDKEFTMIVYNHAQVYLWLKRMERWFPMIEERLRVMNLPDDLKWVAIVESDLVPNVCSPKGAAGPWQFMPSTGSAYGLDQRGSVDKRYDFERATDGAFLYLNDLYKKYRNWAVAIAAYNCGDRRILDAFHNQGTRDYYHMKLPQETERYVIRILAVKAVLSNPNQYGYDLPKGLGYQELRLDRVSVTLTRPVSIQNIAMAANVTVREFKRLNPVFRAEDVPAGSHEIKFPNGFGRVFEANFRSGASRETSASVPAATPAAYRTEEPEPAASPAVAPSAKPAPAPAKAPAKARIYTVKKGDTLSAIARQFNIGTDALKAANKLKSSDITPGQELRIP